MAEGYVIFDVAIGDEKFNWKGKYFVGIVFVGRAYYGNGM